MSRAREEYLESVIASLTGADLPPLEGLSRGESLIVWRLERARGRVVTYEQLLDATSWDKLDPPFRASIHVQVSRIKQKRRDIGDRIFCQRGVGYGLRPEARPT